MTAHGLIAYVSYIVHIWVRWGRLTVRRYGVRGLLSPSYRPQHAGLGYGRYRFLPFRAHTAWGDRGTPVSQLIDRLRSERMAAA